MVGAAGIESCLVVVAECIALRLTNCLDRWHLTQTVVLERRLTLLSGDVR